MIARIWRGYTRPEDAEAYEAMLKPELLPGISLVSGYRGSYLLRRILGDEVEFTTIMIWESIDAIRSVTGPDYETAIIPEERRRYLTRHDAKSIHCEISSIQGSPWTSSSPSIHERSVAMTIACGERDTASSKLARSFPWVTGLVGLLVTVAAAMHTALSIRKAYLERGGYDSRLSEMLWIGWTSFVLGLIMVLGARALRRRSATAFWLCTGAAAVFLVCTTILAPVQPGFYSGLPIYGGYLLLAAVVRVEMTRVSNGSSAL